jgi:hypothetical protein
LHIRIRKENQTEPTAGRRLPGASERRRTGGGHRERDRDREEEDSGGRGTREEPRMNWGFGVCPSLAARLGLATPLRSW